MKIKITAVLLLLTISISYGQQEGDALEGNYKLNERYLVLKQKSQNYKEYKVIRENVLDAFWKIVRDSVAAKEAALDARQKDILELKKDLSDTQASLKEKEESMQGLVHDSTHIKVFGVDFGKGVFLTTVGILITALVVIVLLISGRFRMIQSAMKERADAFNSLSNEFEEYKRKAMEKQTKLSRELQTERNRLSENRGM
jgi:Sec-independent protein translocase protein TatA